MIPRKLFSLATACLLWLIPHAAVAEYHFDVWTVDSGLPQNTVRAILQSRDGYLWVGTLDGVVRFDGVRFTVFNKANSPGLPSNRVMALYEDRVGDLWIGTEEGDLARYHAGGFTAFTEQHGLPRKPVSGISRDEAGSVWVSSGTDLVHWEKGRFVQAVPTAASTRLRFEAIGGITRGTIWAAAPDALHLFSNGKLTTLTLSNGLPSLRINNVDTDQNGTCWVATADAGLVKVKGGKVVKVYTQRDGLPRNQLQSYSGLMASVACEDRKGNLWVNGTGVWLGRLKDGVFTGYPFSNTPGSPSLPLGSLPAGLGHVCVLFEDREGNLWIGTNGSGLIRAREQAVTVLPTHPGPRSGNIYPICEDRAGVMWLGTWDEGLAVCRDGVCTNYVAGIVTAFCADRQGRLWMGGNGGVALVQGRGVTTDGVPSGLSNHKVNAICQDRAGTLWFGAESGLFRLENGELSLLSTGDGLAAESISVIIEDHEGAIWIGSHIGLARFANGRFTNWTERQGLPSNHVRALLEDRDGTIWIGTYDGGLGRFKDGKFTRYTVKEGMFNNGVFQILEDARDNFWMSSNRGIHRVSKKELNEFAEGQRRTVTSIWYGTSDGMLNAECNGGCWPAGVKRRDGKLWFPTQDGVAVIDPEAVPSNPNPPPVVIESFLLDREPLAFDREPARGSPDPQHVGKFGGAAGRETRAPLRIPPGKANIEIQYTGLSFINSERLVFKYRLAGADDDWVEAGTRRTAYYSHVAPGHYTFTVLAANSDGLWNETGASLAFTVLPAWHQTGWFRALAILAVCGAALGFYRRRVTRLEAQRAAQQEFSRRLIESQDAERKRIAAELHDSLGQELLLIKNRALLGLKTQERGSPDPQRQQASQTPETNNAVESKSRAAGQETRAPADEHLEEISRLTSQALQEVRDIAYNLRPYQLDQFGLTEGIEAIVHKLGSASGIHFTVEVDSIDGVFSATDENHLFRVIQEATNNIIKHSGATQARVRVQREHGRLPVLIEDNGRGFRFGPDGKPESFPLSASDGQKGGFGLPGMAERVRILGGTMQVKSAPGQGTHLDITLPIPTHG